MEMALATTLFMMLVLAIFDFGRMHHMRSTLQHAVSQSTRFATTGNTVEDPDNPGLRLSRRDSIVHMIRKISGLTDLADEDIEISTVDASGNILSGPGGPGDVVLVRVTYGVDVITPGLATVFPGGRWEFTCTTRFRNEEFVTAYVRVRPAAEARA